ncbi:MAG: hypothetical protein E7012_05965 [Alphaproteobacteria bacterium]|nr:hypothetical protein [Alphaproteobacteria bacterium]
MSLTVKQLHQKASDLFCYFETTKFHNDLSYCRKINLVLAFCDYINQLQDWEILDLLETQNIDDAKRFRDIINNGADIWLGGQIKTICL